MLEVIKQDKFNMCIKFELKILHICFKNAWHLDAEH